MQDFFEKIKKRLKDKGERFTPQRRDVLTTLIDAGQPIKAYDVVERLETLKPMSVYRALDFWVAQGLAHKIESLNAYAACLNSHCHHTDSQYMICEKCESVQEIHDHDLDHFINERLQKKGFTPTRKTLEIHGICKNCAS